MERNEIDISVQDPGRGSIGFDERELEKKLKLLKHAYQFIRQARIIIKSKRSRKKRLHKKYPVSIRKRQKGSAD